MSNRIILSDRMLVPKSLIPLKAIKQRYLIELFNDRMCDKCENKEFRSATNELCRGCEGLEGSYKLFKELEQHWSVPQGDELSLTKLLDKKDIDYEIVDKRPEHKQKFPIKFTGKLFGEGYVDENGITRINQKKLVKQWLKHKNGILKAKPRSGKTVMSVFLSCHLKQRTIILADRFELLNQFYRTFMGYKKKGIPPRTNIPELQKKYGKEIIRLAKKPKDLTNLKNVDILLINYQKLVRDPKRMAALIASGKYSLLVVDEVHGSGADGYLKVVSQASVKHRLSLTATDRRKDNRHKLIYRIMGPVVAKSGSASLIPEVRVRQAKSAPIDRKGKPINYKQWHHAMSWLCSNKALQVELLQALFHDLRNGHTHIIVPLDRKKHIDMLVKMVNQQAETNNRKNGEKWPKDLAIKFYDGVDRQDVLDKVDRKAPVILFGMRSMIKQGIDFQLPSKIHVFIPMSASNDRDTGAPMLEQLGNRVATPAKKPAPIIDIWFHNVKFFRNCNVGLFWNEVWPNRVTSQNKNGKYKVGEDTYNQMRNMNKVSVTKQRDNFGWV